MNNKGQMGIGILISIAITVIVGAVLLVTSAQNVGDTTNTIGATNITQTVVDGTAVNIPGRSWEGLVVHNISGFLIPAANYTLANDQVVNGDLTATLVANQPLVFGLSWNLTGTYQPSTYISSSGGRSIAGLITIFFALAIAVVALLPALQSKLGEFMR